MNYLLREMETSPGMTYSQKINLAAQRIVDFPYQAYGVSVEEDQAFREELNIQIVRNYFMREIAYETPELWKIQLETRLNTIMPRYRELYKSTLFEMDFESPYHLITTHAQKTDDKRDINRSGGKEDQSASGATTMYGQQISDKGNQGVSGSEHTRTDNSDFPQASFQNGDYVTASSESDTSSSSHTDTESIRKHSGNDQMTSSDQTKGTWNDKSNDIYNQIMGYIHDVSGHTSNIEILEAVAKWRDLIVNINEMIVTELADLFMMIYN